MKKQSQKITPQEITAAKDVKPALISLGFTEHSNNQYVFTSPSGDKLKVDLGKDGGIVDYGGAIVVHHQSACRLAKPEDLSYCIVLFFS